VSHERLSDEELTDLTEAIGQKFYDLVREKERRGLVAQQPSAVVAYELKVLRARITAHHELSTLSQEAIAESLGGMCRICERAIASVDRPSDPAGLAAAEPPGRPPDGQAAA
jgi:hypothetical protein